MARSERRWRIEKLVPGGDGFARASDGRAAFVTGALPGDEIEPLELEQRRGHLRARAFRLLEPGPARVVAPCPVVDACGGCNWMKLERGAQLAAKSELVRQALERTGGFRVSAPIPVVGAGPDLHYRSRIRLHVDRAGRVGFYARGTRRLVEIPGCTVAERELDQALLALRRIAESLGAELAVFEEIELRHAPAGPPLVLIGRLRSADREPAPALRQALEREFSVHVVGRPGAASSQQRWPLFEAVELAAPADAFTQVNWHVNRALVEAVVGGARARKLQRFCDVYAGAGNFSLALLAAGLRGISIERHAGAVSAARQAARAAGLPGDGFRSGDVAGELPRLLRAGTPFDLVVLDPPRSGAKDVLDSVARLGAAHVAAIGCDPVTLARDLKTLCALGYELGAVSAYDMFPHTHHVETLAWLGRRSGAGASPQSRPPS